MGIKSILNVVNFALNPKAKVFEKNQKEEMVYCSKCGTHVPASEYWKNASRDNGLQYYCKKHQLEYVQNYYWNNKAKCNLKSRLRNELKAGKISQRQFDKAMIKADNM